MPTENTKPEHPDGIEDLTMSETETANVKGGAKDYLLVIDGIKGESDDTRR